MFTAAISKYEKSGHSVRDAIELSGAFDGITRGDSVFVKPNIVLWTMKAVYPKWGVITTSVVMEEVVACLSDLGVGQIIIGEGIITLDPDDKETPEDAFRKLGYYELQKRYGAEPLNIMERPFDKVEVADDMNLWISRDAREADKIVNVPVLKTHAQAKVSLAMKNIKGLLNMPSRKKCHATDPSRPLDYWISTLPGILPPAVAVIDGIYTLERGPSPEGKARRSDIIIASKDLLTADMVGASVLGHEPADVPSLFIAAEEAGRPVDLSDINVRGVAIESVASFHKYDFPYNENGTLHGKMEKMGIEGLSFRKFDSTLCTYCSLVNGAMLTAIMMAWKGEPWDNVEVLTGKVMDPEPGMNHTVLVGQCMCNRHKDNPDIKNAIMVPGCPPDPLEAGKALQRAGIDVNMAIFENIEPGLGFLMQKYTDKPEFEESFYTLV